MARLVKRLYSNFSTEQPSSELPTPGNTNKIKTPPRKSNSLVAFAKGSSAAGTEPVTPSSPSSYADTVEHHVDNSSLSLSDSSLDRASRVFESGDDNGTQVTNSNRSQSAIPKLPPPPDKSTFLNMGRKSRLGPAVNGRRVSSSQYRQLEKAESSDDQREHVASESGEPSRSSSSKGPKANESYDLRTREGTNRRTAYQEAGMVNVAAEEAMLSPGHNVHGAGISSSRSRSPSSVSRSPKNGRPPPLPQNQGNLSASDISHSELQNPEGHSQALQFVYNPEVAASLAAKLRGNTGSNTEYNNNLSRGRDLVRAQLAVSPQKQREPYGHGEGKTHDIFKDLNDLRQKRERLRLRSLTSSPPRAPIGSSKKSVGSHPVDLDEDLEDTEDEEEVEDDTLQRAGDDNSRDSASSTTPPQQVRSHSFGSISNKHNRRRRRSSRGLSAKGTVTIEEMERNIAERINEERVKQEAEKKRLMEEREEIQAKMLEAQAERTAVEKVADERLEEYKTVRAETEKIREELRESEETASELRRELDELRFFHEIDEEGAGAKNITSGSQQQVSGSFSSESKAVREEYEKKLRMAKKREEQLENDVTQQRKENHDLTVEISALKATVELSEIEAANHKEDREKLRRVEEELREALSKVGHEQAVREKLEKDRGRMSNETELKELRTKVSELKMQHEKVQRERQEKDAQHSKRLRAREEQLDDALKNLAEGMDLMATLEEELKEAKDQVAAARSERIQQYEERIRDLHKDLTKSRKEFEAEKSELQNQLLDMEQRMELVHEEVTAMESMKVKEVEDRYQEVEDAKKTIEELNGKLESQRQEFLSQISDIERRHREAMMAKDEFAACQKKKSDEAENKLKEDHVTALAAKDGEKAKLTESVTKTLEEINALKQQLENERHTSEERMEMVEVNHNAALATLRAAVQTGEAQLLDEKRKNKEAIAVAEGEIVDLTARLQRAESDADELQKTKNELLAAKTLAEAQEKRHREEISSVTQSLNDANDAVAKEAQEMLTKHQEMEELSRQLRLAKHVVDERTHSIEEMKTELETLALKLVDAESNACELQMVKTELQELRERTSAREAEDHKNLTSSSKALQEATATISERERELVEKFRENEKLKDELAEAKQQSDVGTKEFHRVVAELERASAELNEAETTAAELEKVSVELRELKDRSSKREAEDKANLETTSRALQDASDTILDREKALTAKYREVEELSEKLSQALNVSEERAKEASDLQIQVDALEEKLSGAEPAAIELENIKEELAEMRSQAVNRESEDKEKLADMTRALEGATTTIADRENDLLEKYRKIEELNSELMISKHSHEDISQKYETETTQLKHTLSTLDTKHAEKCAELASVTTLFEGLKRKCEEMESRLTSERDVLSEALQRKTEEMEEALRKEEYVVKGLEESLDETKKRMAGIQTLNSKLRREMNNTLESSVKRAEEVAELEDQLKKLKSQLAQSDDDLKELEEENQRRVSLLQRDLENSQNRLTKATEELRLSQEETMAILQLKKEQETTIEDLRRSKDEMEIQHRQLLDDADTGAKSSASEIESLKKALGEEKMRAQKECEELKNELLAVQQACDSRKEECVRLDQELRRLEARHKSEAAEVEHLLQDLDKERKHLFKSLRSKEEEKKKVVVELKSIEATLEMYKRSLEKAEEEARVREAAHKLSLEKAVEGARQREVAHKLSLDKAAEEARQREAAHKLSMEKAAEEASQREAAYKKRLVESEQNAHGPAGEESAEEVALLRSETDRQKEELKNAKLIATSAVARLEQVSREKNDQAEESDKAVHELSLELKEREDELDEALSSAEYLKSRLKKAARMNAVLEAQLDEIKLKIASREPLFEEDDSENDSRSPQTRPQQSWEDADVVQPGGSAVNLQPSPDRSATRNHRAARKHVFGIADDENSLGTDSRLSSRRSQTGSEVVKRNRSRKKTREVMGMI